MVALPLESVFQSFSTSVCLKRFDVTEATESTKSFLEMFSPAVLPSSLKLAMKLKADLQSANEHWRILLSSTSN